MTEHTAEPLYALPFATGTAARKFVDAIQSALVSREVARRTPPGPLVVYGPPTLPPLASVTLYATRGILRAAEIVGLTWPPTTTIAEGADAIPEDSITHIAMIGGE